MGKCRKCRSLDHLAVKPLGQLISDSPALLPTVLNQKCQNIGGCAEVLKIFWPLGGEIFQYVGGLLKGPGGVGSPLRCGPEIIQQIQGSHIIIIHPEKLTQSGQCFAPG